MNSGMWMLVVVFSVFILMFLSGILSLQAIFILNVLHRLSTTSLSTEAQEKTIRSLSKSYRTVLIPVTGIIITMCSLATTALLYDYQYNVTHPNKYSHPLEAVIGLICYAFMLIISISAIHKLYRKWQNLGGGEFPREFLR